MVSPFAQIHHKYKNTKFLTKKQAFQQLFRYITMKKSDIFCASPVKIQKNPLLLWEGTYYCSRTKSIIQPHIIYKQGTACSPFKIISTYAGSKYNRYMSGGSYHIGIINRYSYFDPSIGVINS